MKAIPSLFPESEFFYSALKLQFVTKVFFGPNKSIDPETIFRSKLKIAKMVETAFSDFKAQCVHWYITVETIVSSPQGCQMICFQTKNPNLVIFCRVLQFWYMHLMAIWSILRPFGLFCDHLVYFVTIWYI
jgi:hypothetical protein